MNYSPGQDGLTNVCVKPENIITILESSMAFGLVLGFFCQVFFFAKLAHCTRVVLHAGF